MVGHRVNALACAIAALWYSLGMTGNRWARPARGALLLCALALALLTATSCGDDSAESRRLAKLADTCFLDSDCAAPLVCVFKKCHTKCNTTADCPSGEICVPGDRPYNVCLYDPDKCVYNTDCPAEHLFCAADFRCRSECKSNRDCLEGQSCIQGACADPQDIENGKLKTPPGADASVGATCTYNTDCVAPLVCKAGACLVECKGDRDCPYGLVCNTSGNCIPASAGDGGTTVVPSCLNGKLDPGETGIDCGGSCGACNGDPCTKPSDCASHVCTGLSCQAASCSDGLQNGTESDVDCGGSCPKCPPTKGCWTNLDCTTASCVSGSCTAPGCSNGIKDTNETDVDCGGNQCAPCATGKACLLNSDCSSGNCVASKCVAAGPTLWTRVIDSSSNTSLRVAAAPPGEVVVAGQFASGTGISLGGGQLVSTTEAIFVGRYTSAGAHVWSRSVSFSNSQLSKLGDMVVDATGDVWLLGSTANLTPPPVAATSCTNAAGGYAIVVTHLDGKTGADVVSHCLSPLAGSAFLTSNALGIDAQGDLWVAGTFYGTLPLGTQQLTTAYTNGFVTKLAKATGVPVWASHITNNSNPPGSLSAFGEVLSFAPVGTGMALAGAVRQTVDLGTGTPVTLTPTGTQDDVFVALLSPAGAVLQHRVIGGSGKDVPTRIVARGSDLWLGGTFEGQLSWSGSAIITSQGQRDLFVARLKNSDLATISAARHGGASDEDLGGFDVSTNGEQILTGSIREAVNFGGGPLPYSAMEDFFVARFSAAGVHQFSFGAGGLAIERGLGAAYLGTSSFVAGSYGSNILIDFGTGPLPTPPNGSDTFLVFYP